MAKRNKVKDILGKRTADGACYHCIVVKFSKALENAIRKSLVPICHGGFRAKYRKDEFNYKSTVKEFITNCNGMDDDKKKGIIGELLAHIFIRKSIVKLKPISILLNMEQPGFPKGFDLLFSDSDEETLWIAEVKSGEDIDKSSSSHRSQIHTAKRDLKKRLNEKKDYRWRNALNGLDIVRKEKSEIRQVEKILSMKKNDALSGKATSTDCNVILVSTLYTTCKDSLIEDLETLHNEILNDALFKEVVVFCINKETVSRVFDFLKREAR